MISSPLSCGNLAAPMPFIAKKIMNWMFYGGRQNSRSCTKILLCKILLRTMLTYAAPVWSSTSLTNYRHLQVYQSKCLRVIGNLPWCIPISLLHATLQMIPIRQFIYHLTVKLFARCPAHPNPHICNTRNYTLEDLQQQYPKYRHKRVKHILI
jgi:hypothetical protein